jgi:hypothetical protein
MTMRQTLSASGARIRGDDYQHLVAWIQILRALQPGSGITSIGIEDSDAGNADDVTTYRGDAPAEWYQVKSAVDAREPATMAWLMEPSRTGGPSILQRLCRAWAQQKARGVKIVLQTNRPLAANDPILELRDGRDGTVARRLGEVSANSRSGRARAEVALHLGILEDVLLQFFSDLSFRLGKLEAEVRIDALPLMYASGLRHDDEAVGIGIALVRQFITDGKRRLSMDDIQAAVRPLMRPGELPAASIVIQAIARDPTPDSALVALDWVDQFEGDEPRTRRWVRDPSAWNASFRPELQSLAPALRTHGHTRVLVRGYMRLPTWFTVGVELARTAGFEVVSLQNGVPWASWGDRERFPIRLSVDEKLAGGGDELAMGLSLAADPSADALKYIQQSMPGVGRYACLAPETGPSNIAVANAAQARDWAYGVRDLVREIVREGGVRKMHLFLATPAGAALLLGHLWDRMPTTQLYEDLGPVRGYEPSFVLRN